MADYRFPLNRQSDYKGTITFRSIITPPLDATALQASMDASKQADKTNKKSDKESQKVTPSDVAALKGQGEGTQSVTREVKTGNGPDRVTLYLPQALQFRDGAAYDNIDLGAVGATAEAALRNTGSLGQAALQGLKGEFSSVIDTFKSGISSDTGRLAAVRASKYFGETAQNVVKSAVRVTVNPNTRALFRSIPLREFTFQFKFVPESQRESEEVKKIIKWFRTELYPESPPVVAGGPSLAYRFPNPMDITMWYDNKPIAGTKLLPAYLRDIGITYNGNAMAFYEGGDFTSIDLTLSFMETRPLTKNEVKTGVY